MKEARNMRNIVDNLSDDVLVDIFSYLPVWSLCCCKCVCRSWRRVISNSYQQKKLSQIVVGFFYGSWWKGNRHFTSITGERSSLSFLLFPLKKSYSQIVATATSFAVVLGLMDYVTMLSAIQRPTNGMYCRVASILLVRFI
jgi:hypothetical protein